MSSSALASITDNFPQWYQDILETAELIDQSPTPGCVVIRPYGYAMWERMQQVLDSRLKAHGIQNAYFPLLIPESFIKREAKHVEGFSPELAVVTHAGGKKLEEPLVVRPTSETIIYHMFARWISSWRDLPLKINQWANVMRWEMRPRAFLRSREFIWHEGHSAHASYEEAVDMARAMQRMYHEFMEEYLAIPIISGEKPESERFAGADHTYTVEALMQDGKALQMGTSHVLAQTFSDAFDISYQDKDGKAQSPHCVSFGVTTRMIGAVVMVHGDQTGLVMPPRIAPIQIVIVPIFKTEEQKLAVMERVAHIVNACTKVNIRVHVDEDTRKTPGARFYHWEMKGVPLRLEIGPRDVERNQVTCVPRIVGDKNTKQALALDETLAGELAQMLDRLHHDLFARAEQLYRQYWHEDGTLLKEFGGALEKYNGAYRVGWCGARECEDELKQYKASIRCVLSSQQQRYCFACGNTSTHDVLVAKSY